HKPSLPHRDDYVFDLLVTILCDGFTSRFDRRLVETERVAQSVDCESAAPGNRLDNLFLIGARPRAPHTTAEVLRLLDAELARMRETLVTPAELAKARTKIAADLVWGISTNEQLAQQLVYFETLAGDWRYLLRHRAVIEQIGAEEIQQVAKKYLIPENRTIAELVKP
ncbi:MAG: insulinase family protein, partial [Deltaproteobacteria bacterium]|nr:insulinase family protein [Deltaproteobacteria bacterium]